MIVRAAKGAVGLALVVALYQLVSVSGLLPASVVPGVGAVGTALVEGVRSGDLPSALGSTALAWFLGVALAVVVAVPLGTAIGLVPVVDAATRIAVEFLRPVPAVALVPVAIVVFGLELGMQVFLVALACTWPVLLGTRHGVRAVDPLLVESSRVLGARGPAVLRRVLLPAALPAISTAVRTGAGLGVVVAVAAELVSGSPGLGAHLVEVQSAGRADAAIATVLVAALLGLVVNTAVALAERRAAGWQELSTEGRR